MADLAGAEEITQVHLAEALQYRQKVDVIQYNHSLEMKTWSCGLWFRLGVKLESY